MNRIKQFVILFVFASGLLVRTSAGSRSKLQPTERFEFCVARNLSGSSMFNEEDKERMEKIVMETSVRMREMRADPENAANAKAMFRLFAAALACVVADCDSSVRPQRERACVTALEACAESLKEPAGAEVVKEMKKIFAAMSREILILDEIADNSAPAEAKKKERFQKEEGLEDEIREEKKERLEESMAEKKEEHSEKESEVKERPKRAYVNTFRNQGSRMPLQSNPTLESIIADKLLKSTTFNNFFNFGLAEEDAVFYSRSMAASGLSGYRYDIIQEAMNAVSAALSRLGSFAGPNDYAYTIGRAIASVLSAHELTFYADGLGIGSSLVYQLDSMLGSNPSSTFALSPSFGSASVSSFGSFDSALASSSGWGSSSAAASGQSSGMASVQMNPSYVESSFAIPSNPQNDKTQFQNRLSYFLSQSPKISGKLCSGPFPGIYEVMNTAFYDYGYTIASTIATVVSNSLNMLPTEAVCTQYAEVISEVVGDILNSNGYILTADPQTITNKISDLMSPDIQSNPPSSFGQQTFSGSEYQLNPSFSDVSYSDPEIPADQTSGSAISSSVPDTPLQQQNPVLTNSTEFSFDASPLAIKPSSKQDLPLELSSDGLSVPGESPLSSDGAAATNNSWVIVDYPSDALGQTKQTSGSKGFAPPVILEPGPVIPVNIPSDTGSASESKVAFTNKTTTAPKIIAVTKAAEITTPVPLSTDFQFSTGVAKSEVSTPAPEVDLKDAFESPSKLSEFLMKEMTPSLKALNVTSGDEKKQSDLPKTSGTSTGVKAPKTADSPDSKPAEKFPDSQTKTSTEVQPSVEPPQQQNGPSDGVPLIAPEPITDELSALVFADKVSSIVSNSITLIRSQNFQFDELCRRLNELAPMVDLPPLDVCSELPLIDYLLHILNAVTYSLAGEK